VALPRYSEASRREEQMQARFSALWTAVVAAAAIVVAQNPRPAPPPFPGTYAELNPEQKQLIDQ